MLPKMPERASFRVGGWTKAAMLGNTIVESGGRRGPLFSKDRAKPSFG